MSDSSPSFTVLHDYIESILPRLKHPASGRLPFPALSVGFGKTYSGFIYCWDNHHMSLRFAAGGHPEYLKYFAGNMLACQNESGFIPSIVHFKNAGIGQTGPWHAQPWLAQAVATYVERSDDIKWLLEVYPKLVRYLEYWLENHAAPHGLFRWREPWHSGFDNEIAHNVFQPDTILSPDLNALLYLELRALAYLAQRSEDSDSEKRFTGKADILRDAVNEWLWDDALGSYAIYDLINGQTRVSLGLASDNGASTAEADVGRFAFLSCPALMPLFAGLAPPERAERMIRSYVLSPAHFRSPFGIRSLSRSSEYYNQARWGAPPRFSSPRRLTNSNWQGPVWFPLNWFVFHALLRYDFAKEAAALADDTCSVLANSIQTLGFMRENYDAETGRGLYADHFASWNILADMMPQFLPNSDPPLRLFF